MKIKNFIISNLYHGQNTIHNDTKCLKESVR